MMIVKKPVNMQWLKSSENFAIKILLKWVYLYILLPDENVNKFFDVIVLPLMMNKIHESV